MRKQLGKAVRRRFELRLKETLPQFKTLPPAACPFGGRLFEWGVRPDLSAFLFLQIGPQDEFTIECAWSGDGRYPFDIPLGNPLDYPGAEVRRDRPQEGRFRFRLGNLWEARRDVWWYLAPRPSLAALQAQLSAVTHGTYQEPPLDEALAKVDPLVDEAISRVRDHAVPYFLRVAAGDRE
jgi:hypothetical protein